MYSSSLGITIASSLYHATKYEPLLYADIIASYYLVAVNEYYGYKHGLMYVTIPSILYSIIVYWMGYTTQSFIWSQDLNEATRWHASMHVMVMSSVTIGSYMLGDVQTGYRPFK
jgi:hypothetical protein